jgi:hypothetical protein
VVKVLKAALISVRRMVVEKDVSGELIKMVMWHLEICLSMEMIQQLLQH